MSIKTKVKELIKVENIKISTKKNARVTITPLDVEAQELLRARWADATIMHTGNKREIGYFYPRLQQALIELYKANNIELDTYIDDMDSISKDYLNLNIIVL